MDQLTCDTVVDTDNTIHTSHDHPIPVLSSQCNLKRGVYCWDVGVMHGALHGPERIDIDSVFQVIREEVIAINC
jgi:hypothetical protein